MIQELLLVLAVSIDAFIASLSYGTGKIRIPPMSAVIISSTGSVFLALSLMLSGLIAEYIPDGICTAVSFSVLFMLGIGSLFQNTVKSVLKKCQGEKKLSFKLFDLGFVLEVYIDETKADKDKSKALSPAEAFALAIALSFDSLATGLGAGLGSINIIRIAVMTFISGILSVVAGSFAGRLADKKTKLDLSWLSGIILVILAVLKIF